MLGWKYSTPLNQVLDPKVARTITSSLGYETCGELLMHFPRDYVRHGRDVGWGGAQEGDIVTITATIVNASVRPIKQGQMLTVYLDQGISASFFRAKWQIGQLKPGVRVMMSGKLKYFRGQPQLSHPDYMVLDTPGAESKASTGSLRNLSKFGDIYELLTDRDWIPIYPATAKVTSWMIMGAIHQVLAQMPEVEEPIPGVMPLAAPLTFDAALRQIHEPGPDGPHGAISRMKYNEALEIGLVMALRKRDTLHHKAPPLKPEEAGYVQQLLQDLPFDLTAGQRRVMGEISVDLADSVPMSRLLQGEVGSGKTMVAVAAMLQAVDAGKQAAILAPTEVLASQHATSIARLVPAGVNVVLLTGSMKTAEKRQALLDIVSGEAHIIIGTHAIIQESVEFFDLGFVVVDEQHRFGVEQRESLRAKAREGFIPHVLVMTATPIPRTIAMTVFGDLAVSTLKELPGGRKPIQSAVVPEFKPDWVTRALARIVEEVAKGHQAFIVCPRIDGEGGVLDMEEKLSGGPLRGLSVGILHGRMQDKDEVMAEFAAGRFDVLIATTVIEVGVDVPNATVMLIREAESFGVSQLHQLRGRVGRGGLPSVCLFHTLAERGHPSVEYLQKIAETNSGFELAELDLQQRHEGDILGVNQSGSRRSLKLLDLRNDQDIIARAHSDAHQFVEADAEAAAALITGLTDEEQQFLDKN